MKVEVMSVGINEILGMVTELQNKGLIQDIDFNFAYHPPVMDEFNFTTVKDRYTVFTFHSALGKKHGSLFALRWA